MDRVIVVETANTSVMSEHDLKVHVTVVTVIDQSQGVYGIYSA